MDQDWIEQGAKSGERFTAPGSGFLLPSRRAAIEALRKAIATPGGPILLTGEAGSGKTWLVSRLAQESELAGGPHWLAVDVASATQPVDLLREMAVGLGLMPASCDSADAIRLGVRGELLERATDGRRRVLVVDEAHLATAAVLEEFRILSNRLGRADGFLAMLLVGQTAILRRLETRALSGLAFRLSRRVALRPLDADELLSLRENGRSSTRRQPSREPRVDAAEPSAATAPLSTAAPLVPSRPPLRVEEGLIEVGWEPETEASPVPDLHAPVVVIPVEEAPTPAIVTEEPLEGEQVVEDHYAALQAWNEWASNQGRGPGMPDLDAIEATGGTNADLAASVLAANPHLRGEMGENFAPYSQLFSRIRQRRTGE